MKARLPINAAVLKWARTSLSLSPEVVAPRIGPNFKVETLLAWENGEASPTYAQLEKLAHEVYKRPVAVFFFPSVPEEETPRAAFRTLPDAVIDELPPEIIRLYRKAKLFQLNLEELLEGGRGKQTLLDSFDLSGESHVEQVARAVRNSLGITIKEQSRWRSPELAFKNWRTALESHSVFVFKDAFKNDDYSGFCLYDKKNPLIFVNNSMPDTRQIFTLFHELAHLLFHRGGIDFRSEEDTASFKDYYRDIEVVCNHFATELLVPEDALNAFNLTVSEDRFGELARYFSVSREVILRKYLRRELIKASYYKELAYRWVKQAKARRETKPGGGNYYYNQKAYLGDRYIGLVYQKYYRSEITAESVADYLNVKVRNLPTFEHMVLEGGKL
jgi:Zn-dependent peptidase ImmA (M78 family)